MLIHRSRVSGPAALDHGSRAPSCLAVISGPELWVPLGVGTAPI